MCPSSIIDSLMGYNNNNDLFPTYSSKTELIASSEIKNLSVTSPQT
jgi:hypothetical protein